MSPTVAQPCLSRDAAVFAASLRYSKRIAALEVDLAGLPGRQLVAVLVEDVQAPHHRLADRTRMRQPLLGGDQRRTDAPPRTRSTRRRSGPTSRSSAS